MHWCTRGRYTDHARPATLHTCLASIGHQLLLVGRRRAELSLTNPFTIKHTLPRGPLAGTIRFGLLVRLARAIDDLRHALLHAGLQLPHVIWIDSVLLQRTTAFDERVESDATAAAARVGLAYGVSRYAGKEHLHGLAVFDLERHRVAVSRALRKFNCLGFFGPIVFLLLRDHEDSFLYK